MVQAPPERVQAGLPLPRLRRPVELRQRVGHPPPGQPPHRGAAVLLVEVARHNGRAAQVEMPEQLGHLPQPHRLCAEVRARGDAAPLVQRRAQVNVEDLHQAHGRLRLHHPPGEPPRLRPDVGGLLQRSFGQERLPAGATEVPEEHVRVRRRRAPAQVPFPVRRRLLKAHNVGAGPEDRPQREVRPRPAPVDVVRQHREVRAGRRLRRPRGRAARQANRQHRESDQRPSHHTLGHLGDLRGVPFGTCSRSRTRSDGLSSLVSLRISGHARIRRVIGLRASSGSADTSPRPTPLIRSR